jgi:hypothetical protein
MFLLGLFVGIFITICFLMRPLDRHLEKEQKLRLSQFARATRGSCRAAEGADKEA